MGQVPPKYFMPAAPYGSSDAVNALNQAQPAAQNPQTPLLPPNFMNPGAATSAPTSAPSTPQAQSQSQQFNPFGGGPAGWNPLKGLFG